VILNKAIETAPPESIVAGKEFEAEPTQDQIKTGEYKKPRVKYNGDTVVIENPVGSTRKGTDGEGREWQNTMRSDYGYILGIVGADKEHLDVFIRAGADGSEGPVYIIDQVTPGTARFDEHKIMFGYNNVDDARIGYLDNYNNGWTGLGAITELSPEEWKAWRDHSDKTQPYFWLLGAVEQEDKDGPQD